jgi:hypothetical protein
MKEDFKVGEKKKFEIISIEPSEHRLGLKLEGVKGKIQTKEEIKKEKSTKKEKVEEEKQK